MSHIINESRAVKYPLPIRCLHWVRAALIIGLIASGWYMTRLPESDMANASIFYPNHKQFGVLVWLLALVHLALRWRYRQIMPSAPSALAPWERIFPCGTQAPDPADFPCAAARIFAVQQFFPERRGTVFRDFTSAGAAPQKRQRLRGFPNAASIRRLRNSGSDRPSRAGCSQTQAHGQARPDRCASAHVVTGLDR